MTIIYQYKVATTSFIGFFRLLRRWKGSIYKLIFKETFVFCGLYAVISLTYRLALTPSQRKTFESIADYCNSYTSLIPVSFVLGFYVSIIVTRWWQQFLNVPWPDRTLYILGSYLVGRDERGRIYRRTVARYMLCGLILILRSVSVSVMKRYPTMEHIVEAGFLTHEEVLMYEKVECKYNKFWVPLVWANSVLTQARKEGRIESDIGFRLIMEQISDYRDKCSLCFVYDWITIPLVYTQVVTLAVYMFFGACLIGRQYVDNTDDKPDLYVPFFTLLQFFFYMGWLKVAEQMINPFGEDDDDFDMNWLIDRHTTVAMCLADHCHSIYPELVKDQNFNEIVTDLPYTEAAIASRRPNFLGSTYNIQRPSIAEQKLVAQIPTTLDGHPYGLRNRHTGGSRQGSLWSLFQGGKSNLHRGTLSGSRETLKSTTSSMTNNTTIHGPLNHSQYHQAAMTDRENRYRKRSDVYRPDQSSYNGDLPPEYVPLKRARSSSEHIPSSTPVRKVINSDRTRKWSFPLSLLRRKQEKLIADRRSAKTSVTSHDGSTGEHDSDPLLTPQTTKGRFTIETVPSDSEIDASKQSRNKQILDKHMTHMAVSRPPVLSAIEEGNTIRSMKDLMPMSSSSLSSLDRLDEIPHAEIDLTLPSIVQEANFSDDEVFPDPSREDDSKQYHDATNDAMNDQRNSLVERMREDDLKEVVTGEDYQNANSIYNDAMHISSANDINTGTNLDMGHSDYTEQDVKGHSFVISYFADEEKQNDMGSRDDNTYFTDSEKCDEHAQINEDIGRLINAEQKTGNGSETARLIDKGHETDAEQNDNGIMFKIDDELKFRSDSNVIDRNYKRK